MLRSVCASVRVLFAVQRRGELGAPEVVGSDGVHIFEDGTAVEHRIGEGHAAPGRRGRRYVMDKDHIPFEEESVGDRRSDVPDPTHDDRQRSRVHASSVAPIAKSVNGLFKLIDLSTYRLPTLDSIAETCLPS
jgi:hypothetical protein